MPPKRLTSAKQREAIAGIKASFLAGKTPQQVENYIENNVTDLSSAKEVLKKMGKIILYLAKQIGLQ